MGPGPPGVSFLPGISQRDSNHIYASFGENDGKLRTAIGRHARPGCEPGTSRLPVLSVTAVPLVGLYLNGSDTLHEELLLNEITCII